MNTELGEAGITTGPRGAAAPREVCGKLFDTYRDRVQSLCWRITGNADDADDALQDTFANVLRGLAAFRGEAALSTWIFRIAVRSAERVRTRRRRRREHSLETEPASAPEADQADRAGPDDVKRVLAEVQALPQESRVVLGLFAVDGLTHKEIADVLGVPEGTVWSRLHRARKRLAERLQRGHQARRTRSKW